MRLAMNNEIDILKKSLLFSKNWYLEKYEDVKLAQIDPFEHYLFFGWKEGRNPSPLFDSSYYLSTNLDVSTSLICPLVHYEMYGKYEGRKIRIPCICF